MLWFLAVFFALGGIATVAQVNEPRPPITPGIAAAVVVIDMFIIVCIFLFA